MIIVEVSGGPYGRISFHYDFISHHLSLRTKLLACLEAMFYPYVLFSRRSIKIQK